MEDAGICRGRLDRSGGRRPYLSALLRAYYDPGGRLVYVSRAGTGINTAQLQRLWRRLQPLATATTTLDVSPPRGNGFGSPLVLSRIHWVQPALVAELKFLTWTDDNLLTQVVYEGLHEDKPAREMQLAPPHTRGTSRLSDLHFDLASETGRRRTPLAGPLPDAPTPAHAGEGDAQNVTLVMVEIFIRQNQGPVIMRTP